MPDGRQEDAAGFTSKHPTNLRRKLLSTLDPQRHEFADPGVLFGLQPKAAAGDIENANIRRGTVRIDEDRRAPNVDTRRTFRETGRTAHERLLTRPFVTWITAARTTERRGFGAAPLFSSAGGPD